MNMSRYPPDYQLLVSMSQGDKEALDILFRRYYPLLCAYARRFVDLQDAEEIVQDMMLWLWENRETHIIAVSLHAYLFKAVYRRCLNKIERNDSQYRAHVRFHAQLHAMLEDIDPYRFEEFQENVEIAIRRLPPSYREAFVMHRFRDLSYNEIAAILNISPKTVDYRIRHALKQLRADLRVLP
jgi:RNA polymerase sigma-70 factor (ECF subfamily)